jgi:hypothetical protein
MLLPYVTRCYKATVRAMAGADGDRPGSSRPGSPPVDGDDLGDDGLLIDFS